MLECTILKDERRVVAKENGEEVFNANLVISSNVAILDEIEFSDKKTEELTSGNTLFASFGFLRNVEDSFIKEADAIGLNVDLITFGNFASVKRLDKITKAFALENSKEVKQSSKR